MRHVGQLIGWLVGCVAAPLVLGTMFGRSWIGVGIACSAIATLWLLLWLPRAAHRAFDTARYRVALRR
ncbi:MAG: hypothetical protein H0V17_09880, partial [Deltaproteobacteria bacterium]|nr:hypothetical protein [Deltaproteobacteria bacterium]